MSDTVVLGAFALASTAIGIIVPLVKLLRRTTAIQESVNGAKTANLDRIASLEAKVLELLLTPPGDRRQPQPTQVMVSDDGDVTVQRAEILK